MIRDDMLYMRFRKLGEKGKYTEAMVQQSVADTMVDGVTHEIVSLNGPHSRAYSKDFCKRHHIKEIVS